MPDKSFEKPEIVQRQEMYWKAKEEKFNEMRRKMIDYNKSDSENKR
jgi:hypothetical protein